MKKLFLTTLIAVFTLIGCETDQSINSPVEPVKSNSPNWIGMPKAADLSVEAEFDVSKNINGANGGSLTLNTSYAGGVHGTISIKAELVFSPGAFTGDKVITLHINDEYCESTFGPSSVFDIPAVYNITYTGLNLAGLDASSVQFIYDAPDGTTEVIVNDGITVDESTGTLKVINAQLPHFSRFGFVN